jgi:hypothetical protein
MRLRRAPAPRTPARRGGARSPDRRAARPRPHYGAWKAQRERAGGTRRGPRPGGRRSSTRARPPRCCSRSPAGRVGEAVGRHPTCIAEPMFSKGRPARGGDRSEIALGLVTTWCANPGKDVTALLAPPVLEVFGHRRRRFRRPGRTACRGWQRVASCGAAEGPTPPSPAGSPRYGRLPSAMLRSRSAHVLVSSGGCRSRCALLARAVRVLDALPDLPRHRGVPLFVPAPAADAP